MPERPSSIGEMDRRQFLRTVAGTGAVAMLKQFLPGADRVLAGAPQGSQFTRHAVLVLLTGGLSQLDSFDAKPRAPSQVRGPFSFIQTSTKEAIFTNLFANLASRADKFALIRALDSQQSGNHQVAYHAWLNTPDRTHLLTRIAKQASVGTIPYVIGDHPEVHPLFSPEKSELLPSKALQIAWDGKSKSCVLSASFEKPERFEERTSLLEKLDESHMSGKEVERWQQCFRLASSIVTSSAKETFEHDTPENRWDEKRYGTHPTGALFRMAKSLVQKGKTRLTVLELGHFDHHWKIKDRLTPLALELDQALSALIDDEEMKDCVVAVRGEFGRKVRMNEEAGRDHHNLSSALMFGTNITPGTYGETDSLGEWIKSGRVTNEDFARQFLAATGIKV